MPRVMSKRRIVARVEKSMKAEGLNMSEQTQRDCRLMLSGKVSADQLVARYIKAASKLK